MQISTIKLENFKGITNKTLLFQNLIPNKVHIFVAPNGFGKTSLTKAFQSLQRNKLRLDEENYPVGSTALNQKLEITFTEAGTTTTLTADETCNDIKNKFEILVINSKVKPKAIRGHGFNAPTVKVEHEELEVVSSVPKNIKISSNHLRLQRQFTHHRNLIQDLKLLFRNDLETVLKLYHWDNLTKLNQVGSQSVLAQLKAEFNQTQPSEVNLEVIVNSNNHTENLYKRMPKNMTVVNRIALAIQLIESTTAQHTDIKVILERAIYDIWVKRFKATLNTLHRPNHNVPQVSTTRDNKLIFKLKNVVNLSNGQKDLASFIAQLYQIQYQILVSSNRDYSILIIDEIFDFLDDANLLSAKYYMMKMIEHSKSVGIKSFFIIMTHIDSREFSQYQLTNLKAHFLEPRTSTSNFADLRELIRYRSTLTSSPPHMDYTLISNHYLHFNPVATPTVPTSAYRYTIGGSVDLLARLDQDYSNYTSGRANYDPFSICTYLRIRLEEKAYNALLAADKSDFLTTFKTVDKFNYAKTKSVNIPDIFFLLSLVYNEGAHFNSGNMNFLNDKIHSQINHEAIKSMIIEAINLNF